MVIWIRSASCRGHNLYKNRDYDQMFKEMGWETNRIPEDSAVVEKYRRGYYYAALIREYNRYIEVDDLNKLPEFINKFGSVVFYPVRDYRLRIEEDIIGKKIDFELVIYDANIE